jgi:hypothetical protein
VKNTVVLTKKWSWEIFLEKIILVRLSFEMTEKIFFNMFFSRIAFSICSKFLVTPALLLKNGVLFAKIEVGALNGFKNSFSEH